MNTGILLKTSFIASFGIMLIGAWQKITHAPGAETLLLIGLITSFIFIITALYEVNTSKRIQQSEKWMWTIGLILMSSIVGFVYLLSARKRIAVITT